MRAASVTVLLLAGLISASFAAPALQGGGRLYLVPLDQLASVSTAHLVSYYQVRFNLDVRVLSPVPLPSSAADLRRRQLVAERVPPLVRAAYPELAANSRVVLIAITEHDMHIQQIPNWQFAFSFRDGRMAVVSAARMDPSNFRQTPDGEILHARLRKMITKNLGILYYGLPQSPNPRSVMYHNILGLEELDAMGETF